MKVCLAPVNVLSRPQIAGYAWIGVNWALGFQANGCDLVWLDTIGNRDRPEDTVQKIHTLKSRLHAVGLNADIALLLTDQDREKLEPVRPELEVLTIPLEELGKDVDLLVDFRYDLPQEILSKFRRTALLDIDPGLLQIWISEGQMNVSEHDVWFTIGETVGQPSARFPDCGKPWQYTPPAVFLPAWPPAPSSPETAFNTVSNWWADWVKTRHEKYENAKMTSFRDYLDLPSRTPVPLELALHFGPDDGDHRKMLEEKGWSVRHALDVSSSLDDFRAYIQASRGEFSCAKPSCMRLQNAWVSDRTICYLASGKPVVVQHTGPSRFLPDDEGMFRFRDMDEAARYLDAASADYERQSRMARALAEEYFDGQKLAKSVLERALA